jgi:thioredoxin-related protein
MNKILFFTLLLIVSCKSGTNKEVASDEFNWVDINKAATMPNSENKMYFIDVYTDWCGWCKVMDKETFSKPEVQKALAARFHTVKFNAEQKESITFNNQTYEYQASGGRGGINMLAAAMLQGELSFPSYVILNKNKEIIKVTRGFIAADEFLKELSSIK